MAGLLWNTAEAAHVYISYEVQHRDHLQWHSSQHERQLEISQVQLQGNFQKLMLQLRTHKSSSVHSLKLVSVSHSHSLSRT